MRITMGMVMSQYKNNLNNSLNLLNEANQRELTLRKFNKASEDPFSASKAYQLRREYLKNESYQSDLSDASDQIFLAHTTIQSINKTLTEAGSGDCIQAISDTTSDTGRSAIAEKLRGLQQTILAEANTQFGSKYIFGGSNTSSVPFTVGSKGNLLYRGIDVDTGEIEAGSTLSYNGAQITLGDKQFDGFKIQVTTADGATPSVSADTSSKTLTVNLPTGAKNSDVLAALKASPSLTASNDSSVTFDLSKAAMSGDMNSPVSTAPQTDTAISNIGATDADRKLAFQKLMGEQTYVDIGMGLSFDSTGKINDQSVFNSSIPGISFLGCNTTDGTQTGVSNNLYNLLGQIADKLDGGSNSTGFTYSYDAVKPYLDNFTAQQDVLLNKMTEVDAKYSFLTTTKTNLTSIGDKVNEKIDSTEFVEFEDAVTEQLYQQYAYNAALKVGAQILQPTFLDFMT
nr:hypothetical protein [uncultured Caproiciproducens sp.]